MTSKTLDGAMSACGVDPSIASQLIQMGWTVQSFACAALDMQELDKNCGQRFSQRKNLVYCKRPL